MVERDPVRTEELRALDEHVVEAERVGRVVESHPAGLLPSVAQRLPAASKAIPFAPATPLANGTASGTGAVGGG
jgi:hypothetical protein